MKLSFDQLPNVVSEIHYQILEIKELLQRSKPEVKEIVIDPFAANRLLDVNELSKLLRFSRGSVYNLIYNRKIPYTKIGRRVYFESETIDAWLRKNEHKTYAQLIKEADENLRN